MPGASPETRPVKVLNANWVPGAGGEDGRFELMIVTEDDQQHMANADTILLWDATNTTLIATNIVGTWLRATGVTRA